MTQKTGLHIGIELGGTGCKIAIYEEDHKSSDEPLRQVSVNKVKTSESDANETIKDLIQAGKTILEQLTGNPKALADSMGIAAFGPVCLDKSSPQYGNITTTPKLAWQNFPVLSKLSEGFGFNTDERKNRVFFDTDVNVPAMFEYVQAKKNNDPNINESLCYVTVGTGVGIGLIINGKCVHGMMHPEGGHVRVPIDPREQTLYNGFTGVCPFHGDCIEGLVTNKAIKERLGLKDVDQAAQLTDDNPIWDVIGGYLGVFCSNLYLTVSVERIIIGGGICGRPVVMENIRKYFMQSLNKYVQMKQIEAGDIDKFIVRPTMDDVGTRAAATCGFNAMNESCQSQSTVLVESSTTTPNDTTLNQSQPVES